MNPLEKFWITESATMEQGVARIQTNDSRSVVVIGAEGKVVGVFTEGDVMRALLAGIDLHAPVSKVMKPSFRYLQKHDLKAARKLIINLGITMIPVVDNDFRLESVITLRDVFKDEIE